MKIHVLKSRSEKMSVMFVRRRMKEIIVLVKNKCYTWNYMRMTGQDTWITKKMTTRVSH